MTLEKKKRLRARFFKELGENGEVFKAMFREGRIIALNHRK